MSFYYLIDFENVREMGISSLPPTDSADHIYIFYTDNAAKLNMDAMLGHDAELKFIKVAAGKQSLDMHLVSVLGFLLRDRGGENEYIVVSRDNGFDNVINFWKSKGFAVGRHTANAPVPETEERVEKPEEKKKNKRNRKDPSEKKNGRRKKEKQEAVVESTESLPVMLMDSGIPAPEAYSSSEEIEAELSEKEELLIDEELPFKEETSVEEELSVKENASLEDAMNQPEEPEAEEPVIVEEPEAEMAAEEETSEEIVKAEEPAVEESMAEKVFVEEAPAEAVEEKVEVVEEAPVEVEKEVKKEIDPHTLMNNKLMGLLRNKLDANTLGAIASIVIRNMDVKNYKQVIYRAMVKKFGQKQGLEYYNMIKKEI